MSNYPHSASFSASLSTSPYALQSNLENLINRARASPQVHRVHDEDGDHPTGSNSQFYTRDYPHLRPTVIREASYDDGAAILLADDEEDDPSAIANERSALLNGNGNGRTTSRRASRARRTSYGTTSEPLRDPTAPAGRRMSATNHGPTGKAGNSRSRSKARSPPRIAVPPEATSYESTDSPLGIAPSSASALEDKSPGGGGGGSGGRSPHSRRSSQHSSRRGRDAEERPLSLLSPHTSSQLLMTKAYARRQSITSRFAEDSSGDEGGDVARGLVNGGGATMMGGGGRIAGAGMEVDPILELNQEDLELPVNSEGQEVRVWTEALRAEIPIIIRSAIPIFITQSAEWSLVLASVISIGHLGTTDLAAASLASMTASVSSFSILNGLATAMDTLLPAAWTSSDPTRVGLWTQRMAVVMTVSMIPMFVLWWNVEGILLALGQAHQAAMYLRWLSIGIPGYGGTILIKKYLQAQNIMIIPTYVLFIVAPMNIVLNLLFVWGPPWIRLGFVGGALATATSYCVNFLLLLIWALFYGPREAFYPFRLTHVFSKLGTVTSLGLAGTIMVSSEWWAWEVCALAASLLGPISLAAQSCLLSTASTFFQVPASLGIASAVRTGNLLGAGRGWEAKWASRASLFLSVVFALINSVICIVFRKNWGYLFNDDPEVVAIVASIMPYIALFQITDGVGAAAGAVLRSLGLYTTGALINLTSYYIIGLPFGLWLTFEPRFHLGLVGLWIGLSVALGYGSLLSATLVWRANWTRAVERVRERLGLAPNVEVAPDGKVDYPTNGGLGLEDVDEEAEDDERSDAGRRV